MILEIKGLDLAEAKNINFSINKNGMIGIIGRNGIGKSTFFSMLSGEISTEKGEIKRGEVSYLPDVESFDDNLKMKDYFKLLSIQEREAALRFSKIFEADKFYHKKIGKYSLGMKELFATILSFSVKSDILIIDELFSGLDVAVKQKVYIELARISKYKLVLITSHNLNELEYFCDNTYLLSENGLELVNNFDEAAKKIGYLRKIIEY